MSEYVVSSYRYRRIDLQLLHQSRCFFHICHLSKPRQLLSSLDILCSLSYCRKNAHPRLLVSIPLAVSGFVHFNEYQFDECTFSLLLLLGPLPQHSTTAPACVFSCSYSFSSLLAALVVIDILVLCMRICPQLSASEAVSWSVRQSNLDMDIKY